MKISFKALAIATFAALCSLTTMAQENERPRFNPEQNVERKANHIANLLALDDATSTKFVSTFTEYDKELRTIYQSAAKSRQQADSLRSDNEVEQSIKAGFERQQKILDLKKSYYEKYRKFLSPKQIERVFSFDEMDRRQPMRPNFKQGKNDKRMPQPKAGDNKE